MYTENITENNQKKNGEEILCHSEMNCEQCIYGYCYDACNANWVNKQQYEKMLKQHKCPYYSDGHKMYLEYIVSEETE